VLLEGLGQLKNPITSMGVEPATFRLVAQCLNQPRYRFLLGTILIIMPVRAPATVSEIYCYFPQSFQVNANRAVPVQNTKAWKRVVYRPEVKLRAFLEAVP
jgi:uncharacterized protein YbbC (DUF1343 family)